MNHTPSLSDIFTPSQQSQLAILLAEIMALGHGSLEITVSTIGLSFSAQNDLLGQFLLMIDQTLTEMQVIPR